tara:strand:+ start:414 stop:1712 length:1299 start_codon:yes stop_codon:yes gene_type:complete
MRLLACLLLLWAVPAHAFVPVQVIEAEGKTAWLAEETSVPAFEIRLRFTNSGSAFDPKEKLGLAWLAGAMLEEGTTEHDAQAFARALEEKAISLNVSVGEEDIIVHLKSLSAERETAIALMRELLSKPALNTERLREVKQRMQAIRQRQQESPYYHASQLWWRTAYGDHPYSWPTLGTEESVANLTAEDLKAFYQRHVTQANMTISAAGDISASQLRDFLQQLRALPLADRFTATDIPAPQWQASTDHASHAMDVPQSVIQFGGPGISRDDPDFYAAFVFNQIVGGSSLTSILGEEVRKKKGYTYGINTDLQQLGETAYWIGQYATQAATAEASLDVVRQTLQHVAAGITDAQMQQAKDYLTGSFPLQLDSNAGLIAYLDSMQRYELGPDYLDKRNAYIRAVDMAAVNRVAKRLLSDKGLLYVVAGQQARDE